MLGIEKVIEYYIITDNIISQKRQIKYFKYRLYRVIRLEELPDNLQNMFKNLIYEFRKNIYIPKVDPTELVRVFFNIQTTPKLQEVQDQYILALHFVFTDEVFPLSKKIDEKYRKIRKKEFGRIADIESILVFPKDKFIRYLHNNMTIGTYSMPLHLKGIEFIYIPIIFFNSWNHMMSTRWTLDIVKRLGGYRKIKNVEFEEGTRLDAEDFAKGLN